MEMKKISESEQMLLKLKEAVIRNPVLSFPCLSALKQKKKTIFSLHKERDPLC